MRKQKAIKICKNNNISLFKKQYIECHKGKSKNYKVITEEIYTDGSYAFFWDFRYRILKQFKVFCFIYSNEIVEKSPVKDKKWLTCHEKWVAIVGEKNENR